MSYPAQPPRLLAFAFNSSSGLLVRALQNPPLHRLWVVWGMLGVLFSRLCVGRLMRTPEFEPDSRAQEQQHQNPTARGFGPSVIRTSSNFETIPSNKIVAGPTGPAKNFVRVSFLPSELQTIAGFKSSRPHQVTHTYNWDPRFGLAVLSRYRIAGLQFCHTHLLVRTRKCLMPTG